MTIFFWIVIVILLLFIYRWYRFNLDFKIPHDNGIPFLYNFLTLTKYVKEVNQFKFFIISFQKKKKKKKKIREEDMIISWTWQINLVEYLVIFFFIFWYFFLKFFFLGFTLFWREPIVILSNGEDVDYILKTNFYNFDKVKKNKIKNKKIKN